MAERRISKDGQWILERQDDGTITRIPRQGNAPQMPADPTFPFEGPKAAADLTKTTTDNEIAIATKDDAIRKAKADADKAEADALKAARDAATATTPAELQKARAAQVQAAKGLHNQLDRVEDLYDKNFRNNGLSAIGEFNPWSGANKQFDAAANVLMPFVKPLARTPGEGATDKSEYQDYRDLLPSGTAFDSTNDERILGLREMANSILRENGLPEYTRQQLATGETRREVDPVASGIIDRMIRQGKSADEINAVLTPLGFNAIGQGDVASAQDYLRKNPKYDKSVGRAERVLPIENPALNAALQTAPGTAAAAYLNAGGFGIPQALNPQAFEALRDKNPMSAFAGDVGGIITGTGLINKAGQQTVGRLLPAAVTNNPTTLQKFANFGRQLAPDATYGAIYGGVTEGDPLTGAATATAGSAGGQLLGKGLQKGFQGVSDPAVQYLTERGIPLSIGETFGNNSIIGRQMQRMESLPLLGDMMSARRGEARDAVYRATLEDAVAPVGGAINAADPLVSAQGIKNQAYSDAFSGVNVTPDAQFASDFAAANQAGRGVPKYGEDFGYMVDQEVVPLTSGPMGGPQIQSALQSTSKMRSGFMSNPDVMANYAANASGQMDDAISDLVTRQAPDAIPAYLRANQVNAMLTPIEKATISARGVPTPKQLQAAFTNNTVKYGGRAAAARGDKVPDVVRYAAENAPNIGNSGTADRLAGIMPFILPTTLGGSAAGLETFTDSPFLTGTLATLAALSTKTGQRATQAALTKRPKAIKRLGGIFGRREAQKGLAGMVTAPLLIED